MRAALLAVTFLTAAAAQHVEPDIAFGADPKTQILDLYLPAGQAFATIVYTYGGGWHTGSGKSSAPIAEKLQAAGYGCALVSHRLTPPDCLSRARRRRRGGLCLGEGKYRQAWRRSAADRARGTQLWRSPQPPPGHRPAIPVRAQARDLRHCRGRGLSPPLDLSPRPDGHGCGDTLWSGRGADPFRRDAAVMKDASPVQHLSAVLPPALLIVGERDFPMLEGDVRAFAHKAQGMGRKIDVASAPAKDHMAVTRGMTDAHDPVFKRVLEFLEAVAAAKN